MSSELENKRVALLATTGFEEVEYTKPRQALEEAGAFAELCSLDHGTIRSWDHDDWGESYDVDCIVAEVIADDYDALVLPGGVMNPDYLRVNEEAVRLVRGFFEAGKPVASICHGPWTLIEAGVVKGRRMTSYHSIKTDLINAGAEWVDEEVVTDGNLVTSRNPDDLPAFNEAMVTLFSGKREPATVG